MVSRLKCQMLFWISFLCLVSCGKKIIQHFCLYFCCHKMEITTDFSNCESPLILMFIVFYCYIAQEKINLLVSADLKMQYADWFIVFFSAAKRYSYRYEINKRAQHHFEAWPNHCFFAQLNNSSNFVSVTWVSVLFYISVWPLLLEKLFTQLIITRNTVRMISSVLMGTYVASCASLTPLITVKDILL